MAPASALGLDFMSAVAVGAAGVVASAALYAFSGRRTKDASEATNNGAKSNMLDNGVGSEGDGDINSKLTKKNRQKNKKKQKKEAAAAAAAPAPAAVAPAPAPVTATAASPAAVESNVPSASEEKKKKKKKKSNKSKSKSELTSSNDDLVAAPAPEDVDSEGADDDGELAFALAMAGNQKNMQQMRTDQKNKQQKEQERVNRKKTVEEREKREKLKAEEAAKAAADVASKAEAGAIKTETTIIAIKPREVQIILGSGGKVIKQIRQESGAKLDVSKRDDNSGSNSPNATGKQERDRRLLTIVGTQEEIDNARRLLRAVFKEENAKSEVVDVGDKMAAVIGKGGSVIKRIKEETGATLDADRETQTIRVSGEPEQIEQAVIQIKKISAPGDQISMKINKRQKMLVIGKGGLMIRKIEEMTKCQLDVVDKTEDGGGLLKIGGDSTQVLEAMKTIQKLFHEASFTITVQCGDLIGAVIGRGGEVIKKIQEQTQVKLDVEMDKKSVVIIGYEKDVMKAKDHIEKILACPVEVKPGETKLLVDLAGYVSSIIGRGGQKVREIEESSGAIVKVLGSECIIVGKQKNVEKAKHQIDEILKKQVEQNVKSEAAMAAVQALSESYTQRTQAGEGKVPWGCSAWGNDLAHWTPAPVAATR